MSLCLWKLAWPELVRLAGHDGVLAHPVHPLSISYSVPGSCWHEQVARKPASWARPVRTSARLWVSFPGSQSAVPISALISCSGNAFPTPAFLGPTEEDMRRAKRTRGRSQKDREPDPQGGTKVHPACFSHAVWPC